MNKVQLPVAIIGAGPIGLAACAHLMLRDQPFILFEKGTTIASNILSWKHVRVFSPWRYNIDKASKAILKQTNWAESPEDALPTGQELIDHYLKPFSEIRFIRDRIHLNSRVISIGRKNTDKMKTSGRHALPFVIDVITNGELRRVEAKAVIDASGTWNTPNPLTAGGIYAAGEIENSDRIFYGIPDILNEHEHRYKNKNVLVAGSGHSSINALLALAELKEKHPSTEIHWVLRKKNLRDVYGGQENDALEARGALGIKIEKLVNDDRISVYTPFYIERVVNVDDRLAVIGYEDGEQKALPYVDEIISNTGSRPDFSFLREVRLSIDHSLESVGAIADLIDPNVHSCGTVRAHGEKELRQPEKDFYIVGSKSYGRAPTFLLATGYEQVRSIAAAISGDMKSALEVQLDLPETGVCSVDQGSSACCGSEAKPSGESAKKEASSCCL
jgi:thioredoxin reductase